MNTLTATRNGWTAKYSGGAYIELYLLGHVVEVINILDYETGEYRMEPTQEALAHELANWLDENGDNIDGYVEYARYM